MDTFASITKSSDASAGLGTAPALDPSIPISVRRYAGYEPDDIPGLGNNRQSLHKHVAQCLEASSIDIPLVSDGFGPCWAGIVYDRSTGRSSMIHVDYYETKSNQRLKIERHLSLPSPGPLEAVLIHGSRTHLSKRSEDYFYSIGCQSVRTIKADSQGRHWAIAFYPDENAIDVVTKQENGCIATRYCGFSSAVYDPELRSTQALAERHFERTWRSLDLTRYSDKKWLKINGHFSPEVFRDFVSEARKCWEGLGSAESVQELLIANGYAFLSGDTLVIPRLNHWLEGDKSESYYDLVKGEPLATIEVWDDEDCQEFRTKVVQAFNGPATTHLDANFLLLTSPSGEGKVLLHFGTKTIDFHEVEKGDMLRSVLATISSLVTENKYKLTYSSIGYSMDNKMPSFTLDSWKELEAWRKRYIAFMRE